MSTIITHRQFPGYHKYEMELAGRPLTMEQARAFGLDRQVLQQTIAEAALDEAEGADLLMVKPAGYYLDVLADVAAASDVPVAAYQVSGEYAMICAAAERGWIDRDRALAEAATAIVRAGAISLW